MVAWRRTSRRRAVDGRSSVNPDGESQTEAPLEGAVGSADGSADLASSEAEAAKGDNSSSRVESTSDETISAIEQAYLEGLQRLSLLGLDPDLQDEAAIDLRRKFIKQYGPEVMN